MIFTVPREFEGAQKIIQYNAIRSWKRTGKEILLIGYEWGIEEAYRDLKVDWHRTILKNEYGTPLVNAIFAVAHHSIRNEVLMYINTDIVLAADLDKVLSAVTPRFSRFLIIGQRTDIPFVGEIDFNSEWVEELESKGKLHAPSGIDYLIFTRKLWKKIPPFALGRTAWDNWLVADALERGVPVVDATEVIKAFHQEHDWAHVRGGRSVAWSGPEARKNRQLAGGENYIRKGWISNATWKLTREYELVEHSPT